MRNNPYQDHLKTGRSQIKRLQTLANRLLRMAGEWGGLDGYFESELERKADDILTLKATLEELIGDWKKGPAGDELECVEGEG